VAAAFVLAVAVVAIAALASERVDAAAVGVLVPVALVAGRVLSADAALAAMSGPAVATIAGVTALAGAVLHAGGGEAIAGVLLRRVGRSERRARLAVLSSVNFASAFANNVAVTAMFVPVAETIADRTNAPRSRYLMAVAFASLTGGMCTLIGTSTNLAVSGVLPALGLAPLGMFEAAPVGLAVAAVGCAYLVLVAPRLLAGAARRERGRTVPLQEYLFETEVVAGGALDGTALGGAGLEATLGIVVLAVVRGRERTDAPDGDFVLRAGDILLVRGRADRVLDVSDHGGLAVRSLPRIEGGRGAKFPPDTRVVEAVVSYNSPMIGRTLADVAFRRTWGASAIAIHRRGRTLVDKVGRIRLEAGDVLLVYGPSARIDALRSDVPVLLVEGTVWPRLDRRRAAVAVATFAAAIAAATTGALPPPIALLAGGALVVATGCLPSADVLRYVPMRTLLLVGGLTALGTAMEASGAAEAVAGRLTASLTGAPPIVALAGLFVLTVALTQPLSNAAAALVVVPIAVHAALALGVDPRPFALTVMLAASCSFVTPFEPACMIVYGAGHYRMREFLWTGAPLTALAGAIVLALVPRLWPL